MTVRDAQNRTAWQDARLSDQLEAATLQPTEKRFVGGPLPRVARDAAAPPTALAAHRLLLQSEQVAGQLALTPPIAGPGTVD